MTRTYLLGGIVYPVGPAADMIPWDKQGIDPAFPERYPQRFRPCKCSACQRCWLDVQSMHCLFGGPYSSGLRSPAT